MRFYIREHQHKAKAYIDALKTAGYRQKRRPLGVDFAIVDYEIAGVFNGCGPRLSPVTKKANALDIPLFVYPHSVRPNVPYDLTNDYYDKIHALFTIARGHKEVLKRLGYPNPIEVAGWSYTDIKPFRQHKPKDKIRVLFAPIHPVGNGYLPDIDKELNAKTYRLLLGLMDKIDLTVRHIQSLEYNGLWEDERVNFIIGRMDGSTRQINNTDVVIAAFTFAHMTVALGQPLVMVGEGVRPHNTPRKSGEMIWGIRWDEYKDYMAFPHNVEDCEVSGDLLGMIKKAMNGSKGVEDWKNRFIGEPFDGRRFVKTLESYL